MAGYIGQQFGNYRLLRLIGHGGFADVYLGEHIYMGTQAAIKVLHAQLGSKEVERFRQEASMVARLEHPHIVRVLDFGVEEAIPYLVLSYAPNGTLRERYPKGTVLPLPTIVEYVRQLADALQYAHNEKIIHRDIKPENILLGKRNELLLSDFGIALISQNSLSASLKDLAGTAAYMAPEQIEGHPRAASDQYALAIVVYEWLCGSCPFQGTFTETALQHAVTPPPSLHEKLPGISPAIEQVVFTALAKNPAERFASVQGFARAFEQASQAASSLSVARQDSSPINAQVVPAMSIDEAPTIIATPRSGSSPSAAKSQVPSQPPVAQTPVDPSPVDTPVVMQPISYTPVDLPATIRDVSPVVNAAHSSPVTPPPLPSQDVASSDIPPRLRRSWNWKYVLVSAVALFVIVGGGIFGVLYISSKPKGSPSSRPVPTIPSFQALQTAIVNSQADHSQAVTAYNSFITSNGGMFGFNAQHTRFNPFEEILSPEHITTVRAWTAYTGGAIGFSSAVVANGVVYIGSHDGKLYALNAISGKRMWVAATHGSIDSSPALANGLVYIGSGDHKLYAFDAQTGKMQWSFATGGPIDSSPMLAYGVLYVGSRDGKLYALNQQNGQKEWIAPTDGSEIYASPAWSDGRVYIASLSGSVYAFDAKSGKQLWTATTGGPVYSSPAVANGVVYVGSYDRRLYAFNAQTGQRRWTKLTTDAIFASPAVAYGLVYVSTLSGSLYAFNTSSGEQKWVSSTTADANASPFVANGLVYAGTTAHGVLALDALTGQWKGEAYTKAAITASPIVANGVIYIGATDGNVYAFHAA
jgi:outer membrane protein assembly factor BamB/serine/threonine protein kinase